MSEDRGDRRHGGEHRAVAVPHEGHGDIKASGDHRGGHTGHDDHDKHAGHSVAMFRHRFWVSLVLSVPVILYSQMIQNWFGFSTPEFPGSAFIAPVLGAFVFLWGGWPFLKGGFQEAREWQPGMMLLISMAITVAFVASAATTLGSFDLDFWWELVLLVTIMLLGHWLEMRVIGQASGALEALAALLLAMVLLFCHGLLGASHASAHTANAHPEAGHSWLDPSAGDQKAPANTGYHTGSGGYFAVLVILAGGLILRLLLSDVWRVPMRGTASTADQFWQRLVPKLLPRGPSPPFLQVFRL